MLDPRIKLQYYESNKWEDSYIQEAKEHITELWESTYKVNIVEIEENSDDAGDDLFNHIFKKRKIDKKDELNVYLNEGLASGKTDILAWWKVY